MCVVSYIYCFSSIYIIIYIFINITICNELYLRQISIVSMVLYIITHTLLLFTKLKIKNNIIPIIIVYIYIDHQITVILLLL